jgi:hypothetical protein
MLSDLFRAIRLGFGHDDKTLGQLIGVIDNEGFVSVAALPGWEDSLARVGAVAKPPAIPSIDATQIELACMREC